MISQQVMSSIMSQPWGIDESATGQSCVNEGINRQQQISHRVGMSQQQGQ